jgi:hypothetical protein
MSEWCEADYEVAGGLDSPIFDFGEGTLRDTGCALHPSCLNCPRAVCIIDETGQLPLGDIRQPRPCNLCGEPAPLTVGWRQTSFCMQHRNARDRQRYYDQRRREAQRGIQK